MLCLEAINLATIDSGTKNYHCLKEFIKENVTSVGKTIREHPEYFMDSSLLPLVKIGLQEREYGHNFKIFEGPFIDIEISAENQPYLIGEEATLTLH